MSHNIPAPYSSNSGLAKGAAVAAIAYHGLLLLLSESIVLFAGSFLSVKLRESDTDLSSSLGGMGISLLVLLGVVFLLAFGIPLALAIWMLVAARRNHPGQVLAVLVIYSVFAAISLITRLTKLISGSSDGTAGANLMLLVWLAILALGWVGWSRMRQEPAAGMIGYQSSAVMLAQPGEYYSPAQQYGWSSDGQYVQGAGGQYPGYGYGYGQDPSYGSYGQYGQPPGAQPPYQGYADPGDPSQRSW